MIGLDVSPLRYPGGKGRLAGFLGRVMADQKRRTRAYVEPFAGGAGAALRLLVDDHVDEVVLNDLDRGVAAFWRIVFGATEDLARLIETCPLDIDEWHCQRAAYVTGSADDLALGFATFYLNRTNRSGILGARPIGGLAQSGTWRLDARFNRGALAERVRTLGRYRNRVTLHQEDGVEVARRYAQPGAFVYADPPYLQKGGDLYLNAMPWTRHVELSQVLRRHRSPWLVTYDIDQRVGGLYPRQRRARFSIAHTAQTQHVGQEVAVFSDGLVITSLDGLGRDATYTVG